MPRSRTARSSARAARVLVRADAARRRDASPSAAVSWVGVLPTHRRRGVLTQMIERAARRRARARRARRDPHRVRERASTAGSATASRRGASGSRRARARAVRTIRSTTPGRVRIVTLRRSREDPAGRVRPDPASTARAWSPGPTTGGRRCSGAMTQARQGVLRRRARRRARRRRRLRRVRDQRRVEPRHLQSPPDGLRHPGDEPGGARRALAVPPRRRPRRDRVGDQPPDRRAARVTCFTDSAPGARRLRQRRPLARAARPALRCSRRGGTRCSTVTSCSRSPTSTAERCDSPSKRQRPRRAVHGDRRGARPFVFDRGARCHAARRQPLDGVRAGRPGARARPRQARLRRRDVRHVAAAASTTGF